MTEGGTLLQHKLGLASRATKDLDGIVRGDLDAFFEQMDEVLAENWGATSFGRGEVEEMGVRAKLANPRRFDLVLSIKGETWRKVAVEISPDEGRAASSQEIVPAPPLDRFGLPNADGIVGMSMSYQIAQKIHAATDPTILPSASTTGRATEST
ncbi:MAG: nucleotidyl transferase AbiEii/AbiGii toxin family protein [Gordonibacter sp.]|uniref:nucleotidyl transferase AbiEii/AbiGii toxin family protein n=1 Tax=Gordonibacter sp. TaxID=1968902 RepID=UPI00322030DB